METFRSLLIRIFLTVKLIEHSILQLHSISKTHFQPTTHECKPYSNEIESKHLNDDELSKAKKIPCAKCGKKCASVERVHCNGCDSDFCFEHRLQEDHECAKLLAEKADLLAKSKKAFVPRKVGPVKVKGAKNEALSLKVAVMKLKQKARGPDVPMDERVYFYIQNCTNQATAAAANEFYLCKRWSVGRCVSYLADSLRIKNNNDKPGQAKLVLRANADEDEHLRFESPLEEFIQNGVCMNGQKLYISYENSGSAS